MNCIETALAGVYILEPRVFGDSRGYLFESYNESALLAFGLAAGFVQENESSSVRGVVRGLHAQRAEHAQGKLVRVVRGRIRDVVVDARPDSPTFGRHAAVELSEENRRQLWIPRHLLHGFSVLSESAVVLYKADNYYRPDAEFTVRFDDPALGIDWGLRPDEIVVSERDRAGKGFYEVFDHRV